MQAKKACDSLKLLQHLASVSPLVSPLVSPPAMALPPGLIQIKGRKGYYINIAVPRPLRKLMGKTTIQKKAGDTLEAAKRVLVEEQSKAHKLFDRAWLQVNGQDDLRTLYRAWKESDSKGEKQEGFSSSEVLSAEEMLDIEVESKVAWNCNPEKPWELVLTKEEEKILSVATALKEGLHHWEEWAAERVLTSGTVTPLAKKRWETIIRKFSEWSGEEYPDRSTKQQAVEYKKHLLTRTSRTGGPAKQSTVAKELRDLSGFWNWARRHEWVKLNIWEGLASGLDQSELHALPSKELIEAADALAFDKRDIMYLIQRFTGCRKQAVCGLRGRDIDLEKNLIHFVEYKEDGRARRLKNGQEAHVPVHPKLLPILKKAKVTMPDGAIWPEQYKASEETWGDRYADSFKDKYGFNSHDLRRIVETQMAEKNISPYVAFHITGHRVPGMSKVTQRYVRPSQEDLRKVIEQIF